LRGHNCLFETETLPLTLFYYWPNSLFYKK